MAGQASPLSAVRQSRPVSHKPARLRPDVATLAGLILAFGGILGGLIMEGGQLKDVSQITAALIVLGGTCGAVMVSTPMNILGGAIRRLLHVFVDQVETPEQVIEELIGYAASARRNGLVSLEDEAIQIPDSFLRKALNLAVDGTDLLRDPQHDGTRDRAARKPGAGRSQGFRMRRRLFAHHRHHRGGNGLDPGDEESVQHLRGRAWDCRCVRRHRIRRRPGKYLTSAGIDQD